MVHREVYPFIDMLFTKIEQMNFRAKEISLSTLMSVLSNKLIDMKVVIDKIQFQPTDKPSLSYDKAPQLIITSKLEIFMRILRDFGFQKSWHWQNVFQNLLLPGIIHSVFEVRHVAVETTIMLYQKLPTEEIRESLIENQHKIKK